MLSTNLSQACEEVKNVGVVIRHSSFPNISANNEALQPEVTSN